VRKLFEVPSYKQTVRSRDTGSECSGMWNMQPPSFKLLQGIRWTGNLFYFKILPFMR